jgi:antitoxin component YwqK of YwqJK toxin-antitoxin module
MQGKGKLFYASGKIAYEGMWSQDQIHGYGKLYNENPRFIESFDYKDFSKLGNYWSTFEGT